VTFWTIKVIAGRKTTSATFAATTMMIRIHRRLMD
jgi:hypothetical protein